MKGYKHLTPQQRADILADYQETRSTRLTAERLGWPLRRVYAAVTDAGLIPSRHYVGTCDRNAEIVLALAARGDSLSAIGRAVGTNKNRVREWLARRGIVLPPRDRNGDRNSHWKGGKTIDKDGYVLVLAPDHPFADSHGRVREHRLVMEEILGRLLSPTEVVHHKGEDGDRTNNDPANLEVYETNADHLRETLAGQTPQWTEEGLARMRSGVARSANRRRTASRPDIGPDDVRSPGTGDRRRS